MVDTNLDGQKTTHKKYSRDACANDAWHLQYHAFLTTVWDPGYPNVNYQVVDTNLDGRKTTHKKYSRDACANDAWHLQYHALSTAVYLWYELWQVAGSRFINFRSAKVSIHKTDCTCLILARFCPISASIWSCRSATADSYGMRFHRWRHHVLSMFVQPRFQFTKPIAAVESLCVPAPFQLLCVLLELPFRHRG